MKIIIASGLLKLPEAIIILYEFTLTYSKLSQNNEIIYVYYSVIADICKIALL